jgi:hypothetical protein
MTENTRSNDDVYTDWLDYIKKRKCDKAKDL